MLPKWLCSSAVSLGTQLEEEGIANEGIRRPSAQEHRVGSFLCPLSLPHLRGSGDPHPVGLPNQGQTSDWLDVRHSSNCYGWCGLHQLARLLGMILLLPVN